MRYPGGKNGSGTYQTIINLMPPHDRYFEPFLGSGAILRMKRPARESVGLDLVESSLEAVSAELVRTGAGGQTRLIRGCAIAYLESPAAFSARDLVYCDPPYLMETRTGRRMYAHEMTILEHRRLLRAIRKLPCMVMISGYLHPLYMEMLEGWNSIRFESMTRGGYQKTERVWFNFPKPVELHDYNYLGEGFRERERIKRKRKRWVERLKRMPTLERQSLLSAIAETAGSSEATSGEASSLFDRVDG